MDVPKSTVEREQTDDSLREERENSDRAIAEGRDLVADVADEVLRHAREEADAVLLEARDKADRVLHGSDGPIAEILAVAKERRAEDATLRTEREAADETLEFERVETMRLLSRLLPDERKQTDGHLQAERVRSDGALANRDDFLGLVAHDLRDLLSGVAMSAAAIARMVAPADQRERIAQEVARIQRHTARATRLTGDLVDVASIDAGRLSVMMGTGDVSALLAEAADEFRASAAAKGVELTVAGHTGVMPATFDHSRLFQVLGNLVGNAIKFSPRGTRILMRAERIDDQVQISVCDQGPGIPPDRSKPCSSDSHRSTSTTAAASDSGCSSPGASSKRTRGGSGRKARPAMAPPWCSPFRPAEAVPLRPKITAGCGRPQPLVSPPLSCRTSVCSCFDLRAAA